MIISRVREKIEVFFKKPITAMVLFNIFCPIIFMFVCEPHFASTDDQFLNQIFAGTFGKPEAGYGKVNFVLGHFLKTLYELLPGIPWFALIQCVCVFVSFMTITCIIIKTTERWGGTITCIIFLILCGYECYARISYIKTSVVCVMTSCYIFYRLMTYRMKSNKLLVMGVVLFFVGFMWWDKSLIVSLVVLGIPMLLRMIKERKDKNFRFVLGMACLIVVGTGILSLGNKCYIKSNQEVEQYTNYISTWAKINNYGWPDFYENIDVFDDLEITESEYNLLVAGEGGVGDPISLEELQKIEEITEKPEINLSKILDFTRKYPIHFFEIGIFLGFLIICFLFSLSTTKNKVFWGSYLFIVSYGLFFWYFMNNIDEVMVRGVIIWIAPIIAMLAIMEDIHVDSIGLQRYYSFIIGIALVILINQQYWNITSKYQGDTYEIQEMIDIISADAENIYLTNNEDFIQKDMPFDSLQKGAYQSCNIMKLPYTIYNSNSNMENIEDNIGKVRFLSIDYAERVATYMSEKYLRNYYVGEADVIGDSFIYQVIENTDL